MKKLFMVFLVFFISQVFAYDISVKGNLKTSMESGEGSGPKFNVNTARISASVDGANSFAYLQAKVAEGIDNKFKFGRGYVGYKFYFADAQIGRFKVPIGIDHLTSSSKLDLVEESVLTSYLTHGTKDGLMISGDIIGNLSYNLAFMNTSNDAYRGVDNAYAARLTFDHASLHLEAAYALQENNVVTTTSSPTSIAVRSNRDFSTLALGLSLDMEKWIFKMERISGHNTVLPGPFFPLGVTEDYFDMTTTYFHFAYRIATSLEILTRHYISKVESTQSALNYNSEMTNTYFGINFMRDEKLAVQVNYIFTSWSHEYDSTGSLRNTSPFLEIDGIRSSDTFVALVRLLF
ncbi:MAG: porin [Halobacteriovoraceae bacterium]|nr:porin [Halobacteriovoraceae bacterium]